MLVQGRPRKFLQSVLYVQSLFFVSKSVMHYCILDVLVAITVVVAKSFYSRGGGGVGGVGGLGTR